MRGRIRAAIVVCFAAAVGHAAWLSLFAPRAPHDSEIVGESPAFVSPEGEPRHFYLRRMLYLTQRPRAAWIRVLTHDRVRLLVNGRWIESQNLDGFDVAITADITPHLVAGRNVIAIDAKQTRLRGRPAVAIDGAYFLSDGEHRMSCDPEWRCGSVFERHADWWYTTDFDENRWLKPQVVSEWFRARPPQPPEAISAPDRGHWVSDPLAVTEKAAFRGSFEVENRPATAWLRITASTPYRLAINGVVVDQQASGYGLPQPLAPVRRTYDITPHIRRGTNTLAFLLMGRAVQPRLVVDGEVSDGEGGKTVFASGEGWTSRAGDTPDWLEADVEGWRPCHVESGDAGVPVWGPVRQQVRASQPWNGVATEAAGELAVMALVGLATWFGCRRVGTGTGYLALVLPALASAAGALSAFDPRFPRQFVYNPAWLLLTVSSVPLQWLLLSLLEQRAAPVAPRWLSRRNAVLALVVAALGVGFCLRARDIKSEPLQWDEVENYNATMATLKYGFPMLEVHADLPNLVIHTSEFQFVFHAALAAVIDDPQYVVRLPSVLFSTITIPLILVIGRRMFGLPTGLAAAWLYALCSGYAPMATVGRYFSQLQFCTLLTIYLAWRLVERPDVLDPRKVWFAAFGFLAMFFTWEGSALVAPAIGAAMVFNYRGSLRSVAFQRTVWGAVVLILLAYMLQRAHHSFAQTRFLWIGISLSDVRLLPMWDYQSFLPWYYLWESSWVQDALLPLLGLGGALLAAAGKGGRPFRFLLWIYFPTCLAMAFLLPNYQFRYIYHVSPLLLLLATAALCRVAASLTRLVPPGPTTARLYARVVATGVVVAGVMLGCGQLLDTRYLTRLRVDGVTTGLFKYPDLGGPARFVRDHMQPGDIVISNNVFQTNHLMGLMGQSGQPNNYIPMTGRVFLPATFPDHSSVLIDRRDGVRVIASPEDFKEVVARHPRIWYISQPGQHYAQNTPTVSDYVTEHFDVIFEDYDALVWFHGANNASALTRQKRQRELTEVGANILD